MRCLLKDVNGKPNNNKKLYIFISFLPHLCCCFSVSSTFLFNFLFMLLSLHTLPFFYVWFNPQQSIYDIRTDAIEKKKNIITFDFVFSSGFLFVFVECVAHICFFYFRALVSNENTPIYVKLFFFNLFFTLRCAVIFTVI